MQEIFIYLSGTIRKSHDKDVLSEWTGENINFIEKLCKDKGYLAHFLNPATRSDDLSDEFSLFGRDMLQTYLSDFVLADMREKRGIGVGYEVAFANFKNIPVISLAELGSHYRPLQCEVLGQKLTNFTHPFVSQTSIAVVNTLEMAVEFMVGYDKPKKRPIQTEDYPFKAIKHYLATQFKNDKEMFELVEKSAEIKNQVETIIQL